MDDEREMTIAEERMAASLKLARDELTKSLMDGNGARGTVSRQHGMLQPLYDLQDELDDKGVQTLLVNEWYGKTLVAWPGGIAERSLFDAVCGAPEVRVNIKPLRKPAQNFMPKRAKEGDACWDLFAAIDAPVVVSPGYIEKIPCGFAMALPPGWEAQIRPRSGLASKGLTVANSPGTIDSGYRGEVMVLVTNALSGWDVDVDAHGKDVCEPDDDDDITIRPGDRIAQMAIKRVPRVELVTVDNLDVTDRGEGGFGSTGR